MIKSVCLVAALNLGGALPGSAASLLAELVDAQGQPLANAVLTLSG